jgi:hypothetical protein
MKFAIQLHDSASDDRAGMAGEGTSSETRRNGTGPKPIENDAYLSVLRRGIDSR